MGGCGELWSSSLWPPQFSCSRVALRDCAARELNVTLGSVGPCQLRALNFSLGSPTGSCHGDGLACDFPEVSGRGHCLLWGWVPTGVTDGVKCSLGAGRGSPWGAVSPGMLAWHCVPKGARHRVPMGATSPRVLSQCSQHVGSGSHTGLSIPQSAGTGSPGVQGASTGSPHTHGVLAQVAWVQGPQWVLALSP